MSLQNIDLVNSICPDGTTIEIEGVGQRNTVGRISLRVAILSIFVVLTGKSLFGTEEEIAKMITILELDGEKKFVKVRVTR